MRQNFRTPPWMRPTREFFSCGSVFLISARTSSNQTVAAPRQPSIFRGSPAGRPEPYPSGLGTPGAHGGCCPAMGDEAPQNDDRPEPRPGSPAGEGDGQQPHIRVEHLERRYDDFVALQDINMSIARGHVAVIIGGSGAGKTTLLKILIGLDRP